MRRVIGSAGGFFVLPLIGIVTPFLVLPVVARVGGADEWVAVGIGQSIGVVGSVVTMWGWWVVGPARLAHLGDADARARLYAHSLQQRALVFLVIAPVAAALAAALTWQGAPVTAALMAAAGSSLGLAASWYSIGEGRPLQMVLYEDLPRAAAVALSAAAILVTGLVWIYPLAFLLVGVTMPVLFARRLAPGFLRMFEPLEEAIRSLRTQSAVAATSLVETAYTATPVPVASVVAPSAAAAAPFVSAERIYRLATFTVKALGNALQSWVLAGGRKIPRRHVAALLAHAALGLAGGTAIALWAPWFTAVLFGDAVAATPEVSLAFGVAYCFVSLSTPLSRNILVPAGRTHWALGAGVVAALVGLPLMIVGGYAVGTVGVAAGLAVSQAIMFGVMLGPALGWLRSDAPYAVLGTTPDLDSGTA